VGHLGKGHFGYMQNPDINKLSKALLKYYHGPVVPKIFYTVVPCYMVFLLAVSGAEVASKLAWLLEIMLCHFPNFIGNSAKYLCLLQNYHFYFRSPTL